MQNISATELRNKFLEFFKSKGHSVIPSSSLVPENDPTVLFTTAGMHPLVPYLLGEKHPEGKRLCNVQRCVRTDDIDEVGDETHLTFFEMMGYWSLGDYWKKEAIEYIFEFLTNELGLDAKNFAATCFEGDENNGIPRDIEAYDVWRSLGISEDRIAFLGYDDNWWGPAGVTGPCGPDSELFVWAGEGEAPVKFDPKDKDWMELCNDVFMQYNKTVDGKFEPLAQKNVDFGMGYERLLAYLNKESDIYKTELFWPIIEKLEELSGKKYEENKKAFRIIADHIKAAVFLTSEGVVPSNKMQGYVLRRLVRRVIVKAREIGITENFLLEFVSIVTKMYCRSGLDQEYFKGDDKVLSVALDEEIVASELEKEEAKFAKTINSAMLKMKIMSGIETASRENHEPIKWKSYEALADDLFDLFQSDGLPLEVALEELKKMGVPVVEKAFEQAEIMREICTQFDNRRAKHQELSRTASSGMFKGGLADNSEQTTKYHTAAHLMLVALKQVLGDHVEQKGSNITAERLRFDFNNPEKLTEEQIEGVEEVVNEQISKNLPVTMQEMSLDEAKSSGAHGTFDDRYGNKVKVYTIGPSSDAQNELHFSREICGGPHVQNTSELGHFKIIKEESSSSGIRRIKAVLQ